MPPRPQPSFPFWQPVTIAGVIAFITVIIHAMLPDKVAPSVYVTEMLALAAVGVTGIVCSYRLLNKPAQITAAAPVVTGGSGASAAEIAALRKESAENLQVLQQDLHSLGTAVMKRLTSSTKPEAEHFEAIAGTITDLAISLAEARESLGNLAVDVAETKSTVFEIQAQVDQQADALHSFEKALAQAGFTPTSHDAGDGAAPGSLGKALAAGASGAAVARLIGNAGAKPAAPVPLAPTDIEGNYESDTALAGTDDPITTHDWPEPYFEKLPDLSKPWTPPSVRSGDIGDDVLIRAEEAALESDEWTEPELDEPSAEGSEQPDFTKDGSVQPDLLALDDAGAEQRRKPRRPGRQDTALIAHVMIGIGNKPYLRGFGPGLSPDKGVPMEYVDVGRWQWISPESGSPLNVTLWKNDEIPADGDPVSVPSGMTLEIHPAFSH